MSTNQHCLEDKINNFLFECKKKELFFFSIECFYEILGKNKKKNANFFEKFIKNANFIQKFIKNAKKNEFH